MDIERQSLIDAIGKVLPAIARKEFFDQADKLAFQQGKLIAYNDEISIHHPLAGSEDLDGVVDGKRLHQLLNRLPSSVNTVSLTPNDTELRVKANRTNVSLLMSAVALPFSEIDWTGDYLPLPDGFKKAIKLAAGCCARDMSRPVLTCVYVSGNMVLGSDAYRVAQFVFDSTDLPNILLPVTAAELLLDDDYDIREMAVGERGEWVRFKTTDDTVICARLSTGNYPDLSGILVTNGSEIKLPNKLLKEALERAQIFAKRDHSIDEEVQITLNPNRITVNAQYDGGKFEETVNNRDAPGNGEKFSIHPDFLFEVLSGEQAATCILEESKIKFVGPTWEHVVALRTTDAS